MTSSSRKCRNIPIIVGSNDNLLQLRPTITSTITTRGGYRGLWSVGLAISLIIAIAGLFRFDEQQPRQQQQQQQQQPRQQQQQPRQQQQQQILQLLPSLPSLPSSHPVVPIVQTKIIGDNDDEQPVLLLKVDEVHQECATKTRQLPFVRNISMPRNTMEGFPQCLRFDCLTTVPSRSFGSTNETRTISTATNYAGPESPRCTDILRDMARIFDKVMCDAGLEYFSAYGMLLGLVRDDRLIPWTADNDYVVSFAVAEEMHRHHRADFEKVGLDFFHDGFCYRLCITSGFMDGTLAARWNTSSSTTNDTKLAAIQYDNHFPYADVFLGEVKPDGYFLDERGCALPVNQMRPASRLSVYNHSFSVSVPKDYKALLYKAFGENWKVPDKKNKKHGATACKTRKEDFKRDFQRPKAWESRWNALLQDDFYNTNNNSLS